MARKVLPSGDNASQFSSSLNVQKRKRGRPGAMEKNTRTNEIVSSERKNEGFDWE